MGWERAHASAVLHWGFEFMGRKPYLGLGPLCPAQLQQSQQPFAMPVLERMTGLIHIASASQGCLCSADDITVPTATPPQWDGMDPHRHSCCSPLTANGAGTSSDLLQTPY